MIPPDIREEWIIRQARERPAAERAAFLDGACGGDVGLRERLEELLAAQEQFDLATKPDTSRPNLKLDFSDAPNEAVGQTLGRYKLLERVGEGGCGVVYVAEQTEPVRRRVALKVIKLGMDTKQVVARFEAERQALAMMDHPNIAKVLDAGTTDVGRPFFVMELVRGIRITDYCDQNNLTTKERLDLFIKVCQAIQHAHQKGIIHRDIKPSNILVTLHDGVPVPKVIDFGIAKATEGRLTDATVYTQLHQFIGTPAYMSPEQAEMSGLDIDTRSDIYSLGVLLYELLAGSTPFDGNELIALGLDQMRRAIREKEPPRPSTRLATLGADLLTTTAKRRSVDTSKLLHQLRGDLDWIVMKCLEKDRSRRYETANGLAADLKRHLSNEPVVARPPSATYRFQKAFRRNKLVFTAATTVAVALMAGIGVSTWQTFAARKAQRETEAARNGEQRQRLAAQSAQKIAETEQQRADTQARKASDSQQKSRRLLYAADMNLAQQSLKLDNLGHARRLLDRHRPQPGEEDLRGWEWRYLWQLTRSSSLVTLTNRPTRGFSLSLSPDGNLLAVGWYDGRVDLWNAPGHKWIRALTERTYPHRGRVAFSPTRNLLVATSEPNTVTLYNLDDARESVLWRAPDDGPWRVDDLSFSQDSSKIAIYTSRTPVTGDAVWVVDVPTSQVENRIQTLYAQLDHFGAAQLSPDNRLLYLPRSDYLRKDYSIQCLDLATEKEVWRTERIRDAGLTALALSPDGRTLLSASGFEDPAIRVWDAATGQPLRLLEGHSAWVGKLAFSTDGKRLVSAASDQTVRLWNTSTWKQTQVLRGHRDEVHAIAISQRSHLIASTSKDGDLMLWNADENFATDGYRRLPENIPPTGLRPLEKSRVLILPRGQPPSILDLKRDSSAHLFPVSGFGTNSLGWFGTNLLCHWNEPNQIVLSELRGTQFVQRSSIEVNSRLRPVAVSICAPRELLAWAEGGSSSSVFLAELAQLGRRIEVKGDLPGLLAVQLNADGKYLFARSTNAHRAWNVTTGQIVASFGDRARLAAFAAGGEVLVAARDNPEGIVFYELAHPERASRWLPVKHGAQALAVSPDGRVVAVATLGGEVLLFDPIEAKLMDAIHGHLNAVFGLAFSFDGRRLISTSGGREAVKVWDVGTLQELLTFGGTGSLLFGAHWSVDGDVVLAGEPWQAWRAPSWEEINAAEAKEKAEIKKP